MIAIMNKLVFLVSWQCVSSGDAGVLSLAR